VNTSLTTMDSPTQRLRYNRSLPAGAEMAVGCRTIINQNSLFEIVRATPPRSAGYPHVRAYLVPELVAELVAEAGRRAVVTEQESSESTRQTERWVFGGSRADNCKRYHCWVDAQGTTRLYKATGRFVVGSIYETTVQRHDNGRVTLYGTPVHRRPGRRRPARHAGCPAPCRRGRAGPRSPGAGR
jgi:hypothetical protein